MIAVRHITGRRRRRRRRSKRRRIRRKRRVAQFKTETKRADQTEDTAFSVLKDGNVTVSYHSDNDNDDALTNRTINCDQVIRTIYAVKPVFLFSSRNADSRWQNAEWSNKCSSSSIKEEDKEGRTKKKRRRRRTRRKREEDQYGVYTELTNKSLSDSF